MRWWMSLHGHRTCEFLPIVTICGTLIHLAHDSGCRWKLSRFVYRCALWPWIQHAWLWVGYLRSKASKLVFDVSFEVIFVLTLKRQRLSVVWMRNTPMWQTSFLIPTKFRYLANCCRIHIGNLLLKLIIPIAERMSQWSHNTDKNIRIHSEKQSGHLKIHKFKCAHWRSLNNPVGYEFRTAFDIVLRWCDKLLGNP